MGMARMRIAMVLLALCTPRADVSDVPMSWTAKDAHQGSARGQNSAVEPGGRRSCFSACVRGQHSRAGNACGARPCTDSANR